MTLRIILGFVCALFIAGCSVPNDEHVSLLTAEYAKGPYRVELRYPGGPILYGDAITIQLVLHFPEGSKGGLQQHAPDESDAEANFAIRDITDGNIVLDGKGMAKRKLTIVLDPLLPGQIHFPGLLVVFDDVITIEPLVFEVQSAFPEDSTAEERTLSSIYIPERNEMNWLVLIIASALLAALVVVFFAVREEARRRTSSAEPQISTEERLVEFKGVYFQPGQTLDPGTVRTALHKLAAIIPVQDEYKADYDRIRFSDAQIDTERACDLMLAVCNDYMRFLEDEHIQDQESPEQVGEGQS